MSPVTNVYHLLGPRVTPLFLRSLQAERILFDSKGRWLTFRAKGLKGKRVYASNLSRLSRGRLIVAKNRLIAIAGGRKIIDLPRNDPLFKNLAFNKSNPKRYTISLDLSQFPGGLVGQISLSYHIDVSTPGLP
ncbi:MAG: hypothetical protein JW732_08805 [Dehalococcoidia bacterium]|nr:hypothetical protein [Dehalococcoidia bacterium]